MTAAATEVPQNRRKRTVWLLAGGIASLLIPLAGALYLRWNEKTSAPGPAGRNDVFERREESEKRITPTQTVVVPPSALMASPLDRPRAKSSLDFVKPSAELAGKVGDAPKTEPVTAAAISAAPAAAPPAPAAKTTAKKGKKAFAKPKLHTTRGFSDFRSKNDAAQTTLPGTEVQTPQDLLKNLPPGTENNPQLQQYLKQQSQ